MRLFLFLDFDGVLHRNADRYDSPFVYMDNFCNALRRADPQGRVEIVISSTWRNSESLEELRAHFPEDIARRIVDVTPSLADMDLPIDGLREREIREWLQGAPADHRWLAIDDRANYFSKDCPHVLIVPSTDPDFARDYDGKLPLMDAIERREMTLRKWRIDSVGINAQVMQDLEHRVRTHLLGV